LPVIKRSAADAHIKELQAACDNVARAINGKAASGNTWDQYSFNPDDFARDFTEVTPSELLQAVAAARSMLDKVKKLEKHKEPKLKR
jgi:hypothetical protein